MHQDTTQHDHAKLIGASTHKTVPRLDVKEDHLNNNHIVKNPTERDMDSPKNTNNTIKESQNTTKHGTPSTPSQLSGHSWNWSLKFLTKKPQIQANQKSNPNKTAFPRKNSKLKLFRRPILENDELLNSLSSTCVCCGMLLRYPADVKRIKCLNCNTYISIDGNSKVEFAELNEASFLKDSAIFSFENLKNAIRKDTQNAANATTVPDIHNSYDNVEKLIRSSFKDIFILNNCFRLQRNNSSNHLLFNLNRLEVKKTFSLLLSLPSKKPFFKMLSMSLHLVKYPIIMKSSAEINWLLILFEIPTLYDSLTGKKNILPLAFTRLSYDISKRLIGLLSSLNSHIQRDLVLWWSQLKIDELTRKVNFINLYITFHINRLINHLLLEKTGKQISKSETANDINFKESDSVKKVFQLTNKDFLKIFENFDPLTDFKPKNHFICLIPINYYSDCWHLQTACRLMTLFFYSNNKQKKLDESQFYNSLIDYINLKQDFDIWQFNNSFSSHEKNMRFNPGDLTTDYLKMEQNKSYLGISIHNGVYKRSQFTICLYPFLISLGSKIKILQYEAKKVMEKKAEEAFISSFIDGNKNHQDIYFKLKVRRSHLLSDSLNQIKSHPNDLKKLLKVEFLNEQGIDAGGLKKEWFLLLTKELFDPKKGLISYNNERRIPYFVNSCDSRNSGLYYLLGIFIGMTIYNSIILDIQFPKVLYKKLLNIHYKSSLDDLAELEPTLVMGLKKILHMTDEELDSLALTFDIQIMDDATRTMRTLELVTNGSTIAVTTENRNRYLFLYARALLDEVIKNHFNQFFKGFRQSMGTNSIELFTPSEIQKLIAGCDDYNDVNKLDIESMKSFTKFTNCSNNDIVVKWFWEYFDNLKYKHQKKLLRFITGSDKIPFTGFKSLNFKITKLIDTESPSSKLPISHTCFNEICLWEYANYEVLKQKFDMAINESEGFTLQ